MVQDNQTVKNGDVILQLDARTCQARLAQARAELQTAQAQAARRARAGAGGRGNARGGLQSAQAQLSGSSSAVQAAEAQMAVAQAAARSGEGRGRQGRPRSDRAKELVASDAIARQQLDDAQLASDAAHAALTQAQRERDGRGGGASERRRAVSAEAQGRVSQTTPVGAQIETARSAADRWPTRGGTAEAALSLAELQLSYTRVIAPTDGVVTQLGARVGGLDSARAAPCAARARGDVPGGELQGDADRQDASG